MTPQERYRERIIAAGKCRNCANPRGPEGTGTMCRPCADESAVRAKAYYEQMDWRQYGKKLLLLRRQKALKRQAARRR